MQETQLLFGEPVKIHYQRGEWIYVEATEQPVYQQEWTGYGGWIQEGHLHEGLMPNRTVTAIRATLFAEPHPDALPVRRLWIGMRVHVLAEEGILSEVSLPTGRAYLRTDALVPLEPLVAAQAWLGSDYLWGQLMPPGFGSDCSGLVHLAYRAAGKIVPRNSQDQYRICQPCPPEELERGDLVFMAKQNDPRTISHVLLYEGNDQLIEATAAIHQVRRISAKERFGLPLKSLEQNKKYRDHFLFFGKVNPKTNPL